MNPTVSIIVPVYNAKNYLQRCIDSILHQEYTDYELFLVDDGSTDGSGDICDAYAAADARITVIHKENTGVSDSRNLAISQARGTYLQFLDSDDWITPDATKLFVRAATEHDCDLVIADFYRVVGERVSHKGDIEDDGVLTREEFAAHMMENPADFYYGVLWNKLYRRDLVEKYHGVTAEGIVESALDKVHMIEDLGYDNLVISIKSSDVMMCVHAHELLAGKTPYPLHVGITESGTVLSGNIKSAIGLGLILNQGIGDTIRVSLTGDVVEEIKSAKLILRTLGLRKGGIEVVSCPTCGRTKIDQISLANQVEALAAQFPNLDIKVAVMGCVVNGPGEAKEADIGIAGGIGEGLLIKKGQIIRKIPEAEFIPTLRYELEHWNEQ